MRVSRFARHTLLTAAVTFGSIAVAQADTITAGTVEFSPSLSFNRSSYTAAGSNDASTAAVWSVGDFPAPPCRAMANGGFIFACS